MSLLGLEGKVVLITGAAAGIGASTAEMFSEQGALLALCDRAAGFGDSVPPAEGAGFGEAVPPAEGAGFGDGAPAADRAGRASFRRRLDVRDGEAVTAFVDAVVERFGRIDVVVNNAGGTFAAPLLEVSAKGEAALIAENFTQVTHLVRAAVPHMPSGGSIVNVTSIEGHRAAPLFSIYAAMKAAQASLTQSLALELAPRGIRVNAMAPDVLATEGTVPLIESSADRPAADYLIPPVPPLGRWGQAGDGAAAILFLASEMARFVTGITLHVDGGNLAAGGWHRRTTPPTG